MCQTVLPFVCVPVSCVDGSIRLQNPDASSQSQLPSYDLIKDQVSRGIVEVCVSGSYSRVCDDGWDNRDASVVCSQMGFSRYGKSSFYLSLLLELISMNTGAIAVDGSSFTGSTLTPFISSVGCVGDEVDLFSCPLDSSVTVCVGEAKAGVACQGTCLIVKRQANLVMFVPNSK